MMLVSRTFIRKRVISMATTASVTATSFALAQGPARHHHVLERVQYVTGWRTYAKEQALLSRYSAEYDRDEQIRRLTRQIVATQNHDITLVQNAVSEAASSVARSPERSHAPLQQASPVADPAARDGRRMSQ